MEITYRIDKQPVLSTTEPFDIFRNQTTVRVGDTLSRYAIQQSVKALYATQQYAQIHIYAQERDNGIALTYQLTSFARIEDITILGVSDTLFKRALDQALTSQPGSTYIPERLKTDVSRLKSVCENYGYFTASVAVSVRGSSHSRQSAVSVGGSSHSRQSSERNTSEVGTQPSESYPGIGQSGGHVRLIYQITLGDASLINALQIQGHAAIPTSRIEAACTFSQQHPVYNTAGVDTDVASVQTLYRENSYPTATVVPTFSRETGVLLFEITEGKRVNFKFIREEGEVPLSLQDTFKADIIPLINTYRTAMWPRRIKSYFKAAGYHDTTVHEEVVDTSEITLTINPGVHYRVSRVSFTGNRAFSDRELLREMTMKPRTGFIPKLQDRLAQRLFQREQKHLFYQHILDTDVQKLRLLYGRAGYPNSAIQAKLDKQKSEDPNVGDIGIQLTIVEGHKEMIHRWDISGNSAVDTASLLERLQNELPLPQPNTSLKRNVYQDAILKAYRERGYIDAVVTHTYLPETETPVFQIDGDFSAPLTEGKLPLEIRNGFKKHNLGLEDVFIATHIEDRWSLQDFDGNPRYTLIQRKHTPHAEGRKLLRKVSEATDTADLAFANLLSPFRLDVFEHGLLRFTVTTEGKQVRFGKFQFKGDTDVVMQHVLEREVQHLEGTLWTSEKLNRAQQSLYSLGLFYGVQAERIRAEPDEERSPATVGGRPHSRLKTNPVLIRVEKQETRTYSIRGGYSFAAGPRLTGELTDSNFLFKRNIRGRLQAGIGWRDEFGYLFNATLTQPWLIGRTRGSLQVSARKLEIDDYVRALQASFILSRRVSPSNALDLRYSYRDLNPPLHGESGFGNPSYGEWDPFRTTVSSLRFAWTYDSRVRYLNPTRGIYNALTFEYAGGFLQGETNFVRTTTDTRYYQKLVGNLVLATALRVGVTTGLRSHRRVELISFERFWAGGSTTVRGYAERSLGPEDRAGLHRGDVQFVFNTELRFPIYSVIRGAFFFDTGTVWRSFADIDTSVPLPASVGTGIYLDFGALTAGVDAALPFGYPPTTDTRRYHLRIGSTF